MDENVGKWVGSADEEIFNTGFADTPEGAIEEFMDLYGEDDDDRKCMAVGQVFSLIRTTGHARDVLDNIECRAQDNCHPDFEADLRGLTKENVQELDDEIAALLTRWMQKHKVDIDAYGITNIKKVRDNKIVEKSEKAP